MSNFVNEVYQLCFSSVHASSESETLEPTTSLVRSSYFPPEVNGHKLCYEPMTDVQSLTL